MLQAKKGFTLIESLVAVALFVLVLSSALGLFLSYSRAQKETAVRQKIINQISFEMEKIAQDIRLNKLQFCYDAGSCSLIPAMYSSSSENLYALDDDDGISAKEWDLGFTNGIRYFFIQKNSSHAPLPTQATCMGILDKSKNGFLYKYNNSANLCEPIFLIDGITLMDASFYIYPNYNPYPQEDTDCKANGFNGYYCECLDGTECFSGTCSEGLCYVEQPVVAISITAQVGADSANLVVLQTTVSSRVY